jgi:hypothetical protein
LNNYQSIDKVRTIELISAKNLYKDLCFDDGPTRLLARWKAGDIGLTGVEAPEQRAGRRMPCDSSDGLCDDSDWLQTSEEEDSEFEGGYDRRWHGAYKAYVESCLERGNREPSRRQCTRNHIPEARREFYRSSPLLPLPIAYQAGVRDMSSHGEVHGVVANGQSEEIEDEGMDADDEAD